MDHEEFAARTQAVRQRLYRTAYLYLGSEADALEAVDEAVYQALRALKKLRQLLIDSNPKLLSEYSAVLLEEAYRRYIDMHIMSPSERYAALLERFPALASELPVGEVASYLGISRRHLHRIREGKC